MKNPLFNDVSNILDNNNFYADGHWHFNVNYKRFDRVLIGTDKTHISIFTNKKGNFPNGYHTTYRFNSIGREQSELKEIRNYYDHINTIDDLYNVIVKNRAGYRWDISQEIIRAVCWLKQNKHPTQNRYTNPHFR